MHGEVVYVDRFGNLITNIPVAALTSFRARGLSVRIADMTLSTARRDVRGGCAGRAARADRQLAARSKIAVRDGNAAEQLRAGVATRVTVVGE